MNCLGKKSNKIYVVWTYELQWSEIIAKIRFEYKFKISFQRTNTAIPPNMYGQTQNNLPSNSKKSKKKLYRFLVSPTGTWSACKSLNLLWINNKEYTTKKQIFIKFSVWGFKSRLHIYFRCITILSYKGRDILICHVPLLVILNF